MIPSFEVALGTVTGHDHARPLLWTNNQDAIAVRHSDDIFVAVVADGCSSTPHSEVGAHVGASIVAEKVFRSYRSDVLTSLWSPFSWQLVRDHALGALSRTLEFMADSSEDRQQAVIDYFLFSFIGVVMTDMRTEIFGCGDGVAWLNETMLPHRSYPRNAPPYLAYHFVTLGEDASEEIRHPEITVLAALPTCDVSNVLIGSDGLLHFKEAESLSVPGRREEVGGIRQFWRNDRFFKNADAVRRRLAVVNNDYAEIDWEKRTVERASGRLPDDTSLVVVRRKAACGVREDGGA